MFCTNCGTENREGQKFCQYCGAAAGTGCCREKARVSPASVYWVLIGEIALAAAGIVLGWKSLPGTLQRRTYGGDLRKGPGRGKLGRGL